MSQLKHTPGPWEVTGGHLIGARVETGSLVIVAECPVWHPHLDDNLRLIAAAPKLLEALEKALAFTEANTFGGDDTLALMDECRVAIAKATGAQS